MQKLLVNSFLKLKDYCEGEEFKGWDPYDGLNSKIFQALPFKNWDLARIVWIQGFKKSPINFRKLLIVPKDYNAKGISLFLNGYCNLYQIALKGNNHYGTPEELLKQINILAGLLISLQSKGYSGACWGYNFDWQSKAFFLPDKTPTIVATSFVGDALLNAYECTENDDYMSLVISSADFILKDLNRIQKEDKLYMFSYSPLDNRAVYNATLLGTKLLSRIYHYTKMPEHKEAAYISAKAVCLTQKSNGAFPHSDQVGDKWRDSFHTGFKMESLSIYTKYCNDQSFQKNIDLGIKYWIENFFLSDGTAKYYDDKIYPIDLHCIAQMLPTLYNSNKLKQFQNLTEKVLLKSIKDMQNKKQGYFYFQQTKYFLNKIAYSRWPNAWMFYGMSYWLLFNTKGYDKN